MRRILCYNEGDKGVTGFDGECFGRSGEPSSAISLIQRKKTNDRNELALAA
jgi:hypothetical protein